MISDLTLLMLAVIIGFCIAMAGRVAQGAVKGRHYSGWINAIGGSILIVLLTGVGWLMMEPVVEQSIAECEALTLGTTYDCEDDNLLLVAILLLGTGALILNLVFSLVFRLMRREKD